MEDPVYLSDEYVLSRMLASETRQDMESYFASRLQKDFNEDDRRELGIWMRDVCNAEQCQPDVFPLGMLIVDRFLSFVRTKRTQLQLLGAVALLLASKMRQTCQIPAKHLVYYTKDLITLHELRTWEFFVLTTLKWDLALITPVDYLDILIRRMKLADEELISEIEDNAQQMIVECCLEFKYSLYPPSMIAWACLVKAMETWQLNSHEHLHLKTDVIAEGANVFVSCDGCEIIDTQQAMASSADHDNGQLCWPEPPPPSTEPEMSAQMATKTKRPKMAPPMKFGSLNRFVLKANLAALDWA